MYYVTYVMILHKLQKGPELLHSAYLDAVGWHEGI